MLDVLTISRPDQLKALGHPLRLRVLETLGTDDDEEELTNRELAQRLGVDPGHLHFHVRMLLKAGLIELAESGKGREKPYRAVARTFRVAPVAFVYRNRSPTTAEKLPKFGPKLFGTTDPSRIATSGLAWIAAQAAASSE